MTKYQVKKVLRHELRQLNEHIDWKILRGLPYLLEARRHRRLLNHFAMD
jgi:DNA-binding transcriptional regulator YdaS (Cro superfamily)